MVKAVPHRHVVLSIPKILRRYFLYDRKLLSDLSRCGWEALKAFYTAVTRDQKAVPGAVVAIQTFGDFPQGFHPHLHILVSDGCFHGNGMFSVSPSADTIALDWPRQRAAGCPANGMQAQALAAMCSHVPNKGEQIARYYGFYSNVARGQRKKTDADDKIPCFLESELTGKTFRRNWELSGHP